MKDVSDSLREIQLKVRQCPEDGVEGNVVFICAGSSKSRRMGCAGDSGGGLMRKGRVPGGKVGRYVRGQNGGQIRTQRPKLPTGGSVLEAEIGLLR